MKKLFDTQYVKWQHLRDGYTVEIVNIQNFEGKHGLYTTITVKGTKHSKTRTQVLPSETFRDFFKPVGRKRKAKAALDLVLENADKDD